MTFSLATTSGVDPEVSAALVIADRLTPLKDALGLGDLTVPEMQLFAMVCHHTGLDPFTRQIYAVKRDNKVTHQTGIDGYRSSAERTKEYAGSDEATFEECGCEQEPKPHPSIARVVVHRLLASGHMVNQVGIARWHELVPSGTKEGFMWRRMPFNQLAKCAEANGLRKAFPRVLGGVYIEEEMEQANTIEGTATPAPTAAERIAARRAAAEGVKPAVTDEPVTGPGGESFDSSTPGTLFPDAEAPALRLTREAFMARLDAEGLDKTHAGTVRLAMFPEPTYELTDIDRGALYLRLAAEQEARTGVPAA